MEMSVKKTLLTLALLANVFYANARGRTRCVCSIKIVHCVAIKTRKLWQRCSFDNQIWWWSMNPFLRYLADKKSAHRQTDRHTPMTTRPCGLRRAGNKTRIKKLRSFNNNGRIFTKRLWPISCCRYRLCLWPIWSSMWRIWLWPIWFVADIDVIHS